jgi:hypothetical protein
MYASYLKTGPTKTGTGLFSTIDISAGVPIIEVRGPIYHVSELPEPNDPAVLQIGPDVFMGITGGPIDSIEHSCNPNCLMHVVGNRAILYSMYVIKAGTPLTYDYSTTSTDTHDTWKMICQCGSNNCRGVISGWQYLDEKTKQERLDKGATPLYISHPTLIQKRWQ